MNYYESYSDSSLLVFLHGFPNNYLVFEKQIEFFSKDNHILAINLPGSYEHSDYNPKNYELDFLTSQIEQLLKEKWKNKTNKKIILVGHDLGCFVLDLVAQKIKENVSAQIHISGMGIDQFVGRKYTPSQWIKSFYILLLYIPGSIFLFQKLMPNYIRQLIYSISGIESDSKLYTEAPKGFNPIKLYFNISKECQKKLLKKSNIEKSKIPTLFIFGKEDKFLNLTTSEEINSFYTNGENKILEGGHWLLKDKYTDVNNTINSFIKLLAVRAYEN